jgi:uncharacterized protein YqeY
MSAPRETIQNDLKVAMKAGDKERIAALRLLLAAIKNEQIRAGSELDQESFLKLVRKSIKQCKDSADQYRKGERGELAEKEEREAEILDAYLPPAVDENEIRAALVEFIRANDLSGPSAIGPIMKEMLARFAGQTDGGTINRLAREILSDS